jgi:2-hydroxychromene-2-carboxylate isomerase
LGQPVFYFDLASPDAYLASHRVERVTPAVVWRPILVGGLHQHHGRVGWGFTDQRAGGALSCEHRWHHLKRGVRAALIAVTAPVLD